MEVKKPRVGESAAWKWAGNILEGVVLSVHPERTEIVSKDKFIVRNGSLKNPAVIILYKNNTEVLKLASELLATR